MLSQYEELALLALAREQLFYHLIKADRNISMPTNLIRPINAQVFALDLGVFTTLRNKKGELRGCIGTLETGNDEFNIESNVKKYIIEAATHDSRFEPVDLSEFHKLDISITVLYELAPITLNQYFTNKFQLGRDGILMKLGQKQGYFLPAVATDLGLRSGDKNKLLDELCREKVAGCDTKTAFRKYSNAQLFYNEGLEFNF
jgi:AmmeMemoRadiSam system protein A